MTPSLHDLIRTWAAAQAIPHTGKDAGEDRARMWLLESSHLVGEIRVLQVRPNPPSFQLVAMRGSIVLDESWADIKGLAACLTMALRLLQQRLKTTAPQWHLHLGDLPP